MATVFNNIDKGAGEAEAGVVVNISLQWDKDESSVAKIEDEDTMVRSDYAATTDVDGHWEVDLVANDDITPSGSVYKVAEKIETEVTYYYIQVPGSATPISWVGDIIVDKPSWSE